MMADSLTFTHADLAISPLNVRYNEADIGTVDALSASIVAEGLHENLIVHARGEGGTQWDGLANWGVIAGGRRWRAIGLAIEHGELPADFPIRAEVRTGDAAELVILSLEENILRRDLRDYEIHTAIARAVAEGMDTAEIARRTGQRPEWIAQQVRLGTLADPIFAAYEAGKLTVEQARAYAATEDQDLQLAAWKHFTGSLSYRHQPHDIRAFLKVGDRELARMLRFVTDAAYREAGGRFELDLFADGEEHRGRVVDDGLLRQLADAKLEERRIALRKKHGEQLRFVAEPPKYGSYTDSGLEIVLGKGGKLPAGEIVATLELDDNGRATERFFWASRKDKSAAQRAAAPPASAAPPGALQSRYGGEIDAGDVMASHDGQYAQQARAAVKDQYGLTADGLELLRSLRRDLLRAVLVCNASAGGTLGRDYLVWAQLRQELGRDRATSTGARGLSFENNAEHNGLRDEQGWLKDVDAHRAWCAMVEQLRRQPFLELDDPVEAFRAFVALDVEMKDIAAAVLAGCALLRSLNTPGWRLPLHDALAELAGATDDQLRRFWTPGSAFAGLFPRMKRLELAQPHVGEEEFKSWPKAQDKVLTGAVAGALEQAKGWVHPLLTFNVAAEQPARTEEAAPKMPMPAQ